MKRRLLCFMLSAALLVGSGLTVSAAPQKMSDGTLFDAEYYAQQNPDVVAAMGKDVQTLYRHYLNYGKAEGRKATADSTANVDFDAVFYAKTYPDVAAAIGTDAAALYQHYVSYGKAEGRKPSAGGTTSAGSTGSSTGESGFDAEFYARTYPDVAAALGTDAAALYQHYVTMGKAEGRKPNADGKAVGTTAPGTAPAATPAPSTAPTAPAVTPSKVPSAVLVDKTTIQLADRFADLPASDDGVLYVYELAVFEYAIPAGRTPIVSIPLTKDPVVTFAYNDARLYEKFAFATKQGGTPVIVGSPQFICNPELLASKNVSRPVEMKGMQGPTHEYAFQNYFMKGKSNNGHPVQFMSKTVALLNDGTNQTITHPLARGGAGVYNSDPHQVDERFNRFMLNANDQAGVNALADEMSWLAANGTADVFIVGNEVNVRKWNYIIWNNDVSWDYYVQQYAQAFRVIYNAVKSQNAGAEVMICIDQNWDRNRSVDRYNYVDAKDFIDMFNSQISSAGNIDWGMSLHPHPVPLTNAAFWNASDPYYKTVIKNNSMVSFENLGVVTSYMAQPQLAKRDGGRRNIIIGEMGLVNTQGENAQGAAIAAAFQAARRNNISQVIFLGDNHGPGLDYTMNGQAKAVYDALGTASEATYMDWAKSVIGITDWNQVLR